jgi:transaldolase
LSLSGVNHITIAPHLLEGLSKTDPDGRLEKVKSIFAAEIADTEKAPDLSGLIDDEVRFRLAFTRNSGGYGEIKQVHAINIFCQMQTDLEKLLQKHM